MKPNGHFTVTVDDREIRGRIYQRTHNDLSVRLLGECPLSATAHIPTVAMQHQSYLEPLGDERARELLLELDGYAQIISANLDEWTADWIAQEKELEIIEAKIKSIDEHESQEKAELRKSLRDGVIDQRTYQTALKAQREERNALELELAERRSEFFSERSPELEEYEDQITRKLRRRARELAEAGRQGEAG